jgi:hypothetical protein
MSAIGGKADIARTSRHVPRRVRLKPARLRPAHCLEVSYLQRKLSGCDCLGACSNCAPFLAMNVDSIGRNAR